MNKFVNQCSAFAVVLEEPTVSEGIRFAAVQGSGFRADRRRLLSVAVLLRGDRAGLSTCIIGWQNEPKIKALFGLQKNERVRLILCVGYAKTETLREKKRKPLEAISKFYG
jgi:nitroreductase